MSSSKQKYIAKICITLLLLLAHSCTPSKIEDPAEYERAIQLNQKLVGQFGAISDPWVSSYLNSLIHRLLPLTSSGKDRRFNDFSMTIVNSPLSMAFSPGAGSIILSRGLILSLQSEGELAFVIAHEIAHQELGHTALVNQKGEGPLMDDHSGSYENEFHIDFELEADAYALQLLRSSGYSASAAVSAVVNASHGRQDLSSFTVRRLSHLQEQIMDKRSFSNYVNNRDFRKLHEIMTR